MLYKTLITLMASVALGIGSTAMAMHGGRGGGGGGGHGGGGGGFGGGVGHAGSFGPGFAAVHGSGMGILRKALRQFLQSHPHVASVSEPPQNEGGGGATVVELRT